MTTTVAAAAGCIALHPWTRQAPISLDNHALPTIHQNTHIHRGSVEDLTENALAFNLALHRLHVLTEKQLELAGAVGGNRDSRDG